MSVDVLMIVNFAHHTRSTRVIAGDDSTRFFPSFVYLPKLWKILAHGTICAPKRQELTIYVVVVQVGLVHSSLTLTWHYNNYRCICVMCLNTRSNLSQTECRNRKLSIMKAESLERSIHAH